WRYRFHGVKIVLIRTTFTLKLQPPPCLFLWSGRVPFLIPQPQYGFLKLSCEIVGEVNNVVVSPAAIVRLIRSLWHLNKSLLAFRLDDPYVRNANEVADIHRCKTSK